MINRHTPISVLVGSMLWFMVLAGCISGVSSPDFGAGDFNQNSDSREGKSGIDTERGKSDSGQEPQWPPLESAPIRPGSKLPNCTTNFVFWNPVNDTVFMGTAAHCVDHLKIGDSVTIVEGLFPMACVYNCSHGASVEGSVAYSGWWTGSEHDRNHGEDFALIEIREEDRDKVHPKVRHYGGPIGLATKSNVEMFDRVLWYGHSSDRERLYATQPNEGYVCGFGHQFDDRWRIHAVGPAWFGDSGSPVLVAENGMALGVLTSMLPIGCSLPAAGGPWLYNALDEANRRGMNVELATWPLVDDGELPDLPEWTNQTNSIPFLSPME